MSTRKGRKGICIGTRKGRKGKVKKGKGREEICMGTRKGRKGKRSACALEREGKVR